MHFNKEPGASSNNGASLGNPIRSANGLLVIDCVLVDEHSRLTITKRIKKFLPVETGDLLAFYKSPKNDDIVLRVQREDQIVFSWFIKIKEVE